MINKFLSRFCGTILIIFSCWFGYMYCLEHDWRYVTPTDAQLQEYEISEKTALNLYQLMKDTHEILSQAKIDYWIEAGTLLGAVRHSGLIPFDDDLDIGIMQHDETRLHNAFLQFKRLGYRVRYKEFYTICNKKCIDIFVFARYDNKLAYTSVVARDKFPLEYFYEEEIFPLKKYRFGDLEIYGPQQPTKYLDRVYPEWNRYAILRQPHGMRFFISNIEQKTKFILTDSLLKPAMPFGPLQDRVD